MNKISANEKISNHRDCGKMKCKATIMTEQIKVIDKKRLIKRIDVLPEKYISEVDRAIGIAIDLQERNRYGVY